jgi:fumarylacetoacetase
VARPPGETPQPVARVGDDAVLLRAVAPPGRLADAVAGQRLNPLIELGQRAWRELRMAAQEAPATARVPCASVEPQLPVRVTDYVDFYASLEHATNVGRLFRPDGDPLPPNWRHLPVGYHGRSSTVVVSGTAVRRPHGQVPLADGGTELTPTGALDFECELGFVCGPSTRPGDRIAVDDAAARIFGFVLLNDWSARDVQAFEYVPLGPFLGKSFLTSISPWIVPPDELPHVPPRKQDPEPLPYLRASEPWAIDLDITVTIGDETVTRTNARRLYWTPAQMLAHATVNGAALTAGDLFGTGTISGPDEGSLGCLLERFRGERWLADGDEVVISAGPLGEVRGRVVPA